MPDREHQRTRAEELLRRIAGRNAVLREEQPIMSAEDLASRWEGMGEVAPPDFDPMDPYQSIQNQPAVPSSRHPVAVPPSTKPSNFNPSQNELYDTLSAVAQNVTGPMLERVLQKKGIDGPIIVRPETDAPPTAINNTVVAMSGTAAVPIGPFSVIRFLLLNTLDTMAAWITGLQAIATDYTGMTAQLDFSTVPQALARIGGLAVTAVPLIAFAPGSLLGELYRGAQIVVPPRTTFAVSIANATPLAKSVLFMALGFTYPVAIGSSPGSFFNPQYNHELKDQKVPTQGAVPASYYPETGGCSAGGA